MPPNSVPSYWIRVVARGVGCAVKCSSFPKPERDEIEEETSIIIWNDRCAESCVLRRRGASCAAVSII